MNTQRSVFPGASGVLLVLFATLLASVAWAQPGDNAATVAAIETGIEALKRDLRSATTASEREPLLGQASALHERALALKAALAIPVAQTEQRIAQLGPDADASSDAAVRQQHGQLTRELADQVALTRRVALAEVEASQAIDLLSEERARALGEALFERTTSPLTPSLWRDGVAALRADLDRSASSAELDAEVDEGVASSPRAMPLVVLAMLAWLAVSWLLLWPLQRRLDRLGTRIAGRLAGREARFAVCLFAVWSVVTGVVLAIVSAVLLLIVAEWAGLSAPVIALVGVLASAGVFGFYVRAMALAILQPRNSTWRLWRVGDEAAAFAARAGNAVALAMTLVIIVEAGIATLEMGPTTQVFLHSTLALSTVLLIGYALFWLGRIQRLDELPETAETQARRGRLALWVGVGWLAITVLALFGALGYVAFANRISHWVIWGSVVFMTAYILMELVDGFCKLLATTRTRGGSGAQAGRGLQQAAVLLSAIGRLILLLLAIGALLVPFGAGFTSVLGLLTPLATGFEVGGVTISAAAILRALLAFAVVIALIRFVRAWITNSYLPTTNLQADARESIDKILRYVGIVLAILWALTAFGVGMEKVAILASALSVGIGFGLQAITQNFVSGLILLAERPVKIGDWVKINDVEGDIRRINVRSTEIRVGDHSTMIVPNSELITKVVQNKTKGSALGRAQIFLSVPLEADLDQAIDAVLGTFAADEDVLETPAPSVFVDRIEDGMAVLNCFMHVRSARVAYGVRSRMILAVLRAFRERDIPVSLPPQQFVMAPAAPA